MGETAQSQPAFNEGLSQFGVQESVQAGSFLSGLPELATTKHEHTHHSETRPAHTRLCQEVLQLVPIFNSFISV